MKYEHKQTGPLHVILYSIGAVQLAAAWIVRSNPAALIILSCCAVVMIVAGLCVGYLVVRDEGDFLALRYGPLPVFRRRILFSNIASAEPSRSNVLDGWGIHYVPGRGMIYNLWGFDCVKMNVDHRTILSRDRRRAESCSLFGRKADGLSAGRVQSTKRDVSEFPRWFRAAP